MKTLLKSLVMGAAFVAAVEATAEGLTKFEVCNNYHQFAGTVMEAHQVGLSMPQVLDGIEDQPILVDIIREAYDHPRYSTDRYQQDAKRDFADKAYAECLKAYD